jgi:hypothetical protein
LGKLPVTSSGQWLFNYYLRAALGLLAFGFSPISLSLSLSTSTSTSLALAQPFVAMLTVAHHQAARE